MNEICNYCDQPASRIDKNSGALLCEEDAVDQYADWQEDTAPLNPRTLAQWAHG